MVVVLKEKGMVIEVQKLGCNGKRWRFSSEYVKIVTAKMIQT